MKREKRLPCLSAVALATCLSFGGTACMDTGMDLRVDLFLLFLGCLAGAVTVAICLNGKWGGRILGIGTLVIALLLALLPWVQKTVVALFNTIIGFYHRAYGVPIPGWIGEATADSLLLPLLLIGGLISLLTVWTILRNRYIAPAVTLALLPLFSCLVVTDTVPGTLPILILLSGIVLLMMTQPVRQRDTAQGDRLTAILAVPVVAVLGLLMLAVPQEGYSANLQMDRLDAVMDRIFSKIPFMDWTADGDSQVSFGGDIPNQIDLGSLGHRNQSSAAVLEVQANYSGTIYLRGMDYDDYTMKGWNASNNRTESNFGPPIQWTKADGTLKIRALSRYGQRYVPYYPLDIPTFQDGALDDHKKQTEYTYYTRSLAQDWVLAWRASHSGSGAGTTDRRYLALPDSTRKKAEIFLTNVAFRMGDDALTVAKAIGNYVQHSATYDLETDPMPSSDSDFAMWFLEKSDTGYCVHFASAATVLLRAAGIPARYVEGYTIDVNSGEKVIVRELHAHAWVEYYLEEVGWVILDPTPSAGDVPPVTEPSKPTAPPVTLPPVTQPPVTVPPETTTPPMTQPSDGTDPSTAPTPPASENTTPDAPSQPDPPGSTSSPTGPMQTISSSGTEPPSPPMPDWFLGILVTLLVLGISILAVMTQWALRRRGKIQMMYYLGSSNNQAIARYLESVRMAKFLATPLPDELVALAEKARFSQHRLSDEELNRFDEHHYQSIQTLRSLPLYRQWIAKLVYALY